MGAEDGGFLSWRRWPRQSHAEGQLHQQDQLFGIAVQQAEITNPSEASWQNVHKQQPQEFTTWQALNDFITFIVFYAESDGAQQVVIDDLAGIGLVEFRQQRRARVFIKSVTAQVSL